MDKLLVLKKYKPTSPGIRHKVMLSYVGNNAFPTQSLCVGVKNTGGRNNVGRTTVRGRSGYNKVVYRRINWYFRGSYTIEEIQRHPTRFLVTLAKDELGQQHYLPTAQDVSEGSFIEAGSLVDGAITQLKYIPHGYKVSCITAGSVGGKMRDIRSPGSFGVIKSSSEIGIAIELPSKEVKLFSGDSYAMIGSNAGAQAVHVKLGKAGQSRYRGRRGITRGMCKNACDHPHGGSYNTKGNKAPRSRTGVLAKGGKTRQGSKNSDRLILTKRTNKRNGKK
jgi:large subunit ribosomal protein L2